MPANPVPAANRSCLPVPITENSGLLNYSVNPQKKSFSVTQLRFQDKENPSNETKQKQESALLIHVYIVVVHYVYALPHTKKGCQ